jgi:hypothetical protein
MIDGRRGKTMGATEGEPNKWYDRFQIYLLLGSSRSIYAAYTAWRERSGKTPRESAQKRAGLPKSWVDAAAKWEWVKRAEAFDENERQQQLSDWTRRRDELRESEWKFSQELLDKARQMLVFPLAKTVRSQQADGQTIVTEVYPTRWSIGDVAKFLEAASKLGRLALGEETERVAHTMEITSDEMARARERAKEWEREMYGVE